MTSLFDVNVLIALLDANHVFHDLAHNDFPEASRLGWATCPITLNGCVRIMSQSNYPSFRATPREIADKLDEMTRIRGHEFWPATMSILDDTVFDRSKLLSHRSLTDVYLLGLAVQQDGRLVTFDRGIPLAAVRGASTRHLKVLGVRA